MAQTSIQRQQAMRDRISLLTPMEKIRQAAVRKILFRHIPAPVYTSEEQELTEAITKHLEAALRLATKANAMLLKRHSDTIASGDPESDEVQEAHRFIETLALKHRKAFPTY